jgi:hypothetical protein
MWVPDSEFNSHLKDSKFSNSTLSFSHNTPTKGDYDEEWEIDLTRDEWY